MATDLIMPRLQDQQQSAFFTAQPQQTQPQPPTWQQQQVLPSFPPPPPQQQPQQQPQPQTQTISNTTTTQQISPLSTSGSTSPTSPKAYHTRQIRPLYMPAVLRPTEHPSKTPLTRRKTDNKPSSRPTSTGTSPSDNHSEDGGGDHRTLRSNSSFITLSGAAHALVGRRLSRRSTGDSGKCFDEDGEEHGASGKTVNWNLDAFPAPKGLPSREHWKPDNESTICDHPSCRRKFGYLVRRHHCRRCGNIFCDFHSGFEVPLDERADYNPRGVPVRACAHCYGQFKEWRVRSRAAATAAANSRGSSLMGDVDEAGVGGNGGTREAGSPRLSTSPMGCKGRPTPPSTSAEVAVSVPRDWNWSTF